MGMHNQLGVAQEHGALDNKTTEYVDMTIRKDEFEDTEEVKDEDIEGTRDEGSNDEEDNENDDDDQDVTRST